MKKLLLFVLMLLPIVASADKSGKYGDNVYYTYNSADHTLTIYGEGAMESVDIGNISRPWGAYREGIHSLIIEDGVTTISGYAFYDCSGLTSVYIPQSVTEIGDGSVSGQFAFGYCTSLTSVTIPSGVTCIGDEAFQGCSSLSTVISEIENPFAIDNSVFYGIPSNATLIVPKGTKAKYHATAGWNRFTDIVEAVGRDDVFEVDGIFYKVGENKMVSVTSGKTKYSGDVVIPNQVTYIGTAYSVTSIGRCAFWYCEALTSVTIPNSVTSIDWGAFQCSGLTSVTIPNSVTSISSSAFCLCSGLTSFTIPNSVTSIGLYALYGCSGLTSIKVESGNGIYDSRNNCNAIIETSTNTLIAGCKNTTIPNSVTCIGEGAFLGCSDLISITLPENLTSIMSQAFEGCDKLTAVYISDLDKYLDIHFDDVNSNPLFYARRLFLKGEELTDLLIPNGKRTINQYALIGCTSLKSLYLPSSVKSIGKLAFLGCSGLTTITSEIENPFEIEESVFNGIPSNAQLIVPKGTKMKYQSTNGWNRFTNIVEVGGVGYKFEADGINYIIGENNTVSVIRKVSNPYSGDVVIPSQVTYLGATYSVKSIEGAFAFCDDLTSVTIPNSVTSIGQWAFYESSLPSLTIPNSVMSIGFEAFKLCSLTSVTIPNSVALIGPEAFSECSGLATVVSEMENPCEIVSDAFSYINANATLIVPPGTKSAYQSKAGWNKFANIVEIEKNQTIHVATAGTLPDLIPDYEKYLIEELTLTGELNGTDLAFLREMAGRERQIWFNFDNFDIYDLEYGEGWSSETQGKLIDLDIFNANIVSGGNPSLRLIDIIVSNSRETKIYSSDNTIPAGLFHGCRLTSIKLPRNVSSIESLAFGNCPLTSIIIPSSVESIGRSAFFGCSSLTYALIGKGVTEISNALRNCPNLREMILSQTAFDNGIPESVTNYTTYSKNPMKVVVMSKGATSATLKIYPIDDNGNTDENHCYTVTMLGLKPGQNILWKLDDENYGMISEKTDFLTMEVQPAKPTSKIKARLLATVNELDDDLHFGFEWLRYDAPSNMTPNKVSAPLYEGQIVGSLNNLNPDVYYKYRPYYKSEDGSMFYGEWESFITGDADVFFEPETHTKDVAEVTSVSAQLAGVWIEGTEDIEEKGFEYWINSSGNTRAIGKDVKKVIVNGNMTTVVLEDLAIGTEYGYRSYMKTASCTTYGEEKTFKTSETAIDTDDVEGDVNGDGVVDDADLKDVVSHIMGNTPIGFNKNAADVNNDNKVNAADIVLINKIINKK